MRAREYCVREPLMLHHHHPFMSMPTTIFDGLTLSFLKIIYHVKKKKKNRLLLALKKSHSGNIVLLVRRYVENYVNRLFYMSLDIILLNRVIYIFSITFF